MHTIAAIIPTAGYPGIPTNTGTVGVLVLENLAEDQCRLVYTGLLTPVPSQEGTSMNHTRVPCRNYHPWYAHPDVSGRTELETCPERPCWCAREPD
eukprot:164500-Rhodomonas_salina.1